MTNKYTIATIEAEEGKLRTFPIFKETGSPYENDEPVGKIELKQAQYVGGDLYAIPMQVYETENPLTLKIVYLLGNLFCRNNVSMATVDGNNIRVSEMTRDGVMIHRHPGERDLEGREYKVVDLGSMDEISNEDLRALCIKKGWFTNGDNVQYERLFKRNSEGASIDELATIIWICSSNAYLESIRDELKAHSRWRI